MGRRTRLSLIRCSADDPVGCPERRPERADEQRVGTPGRVVVAPVPWPRFANPRGDRGQAHPFRYHRSTSHVTLLLQHVFDEWRTDRSTKRSKKEGT